MKKLLFCLVLLLYGQSMLAMRSAFDWMFPIKQTSQELVQAKLNEFRTALTFDALDQWRVNSLEVVEIACILIQEKDSEALNKLLKAQPISNGDSWFKCIAVFCPVDFRYRSAEDLAVLDCLLNNLPCEKRYSALVNLLQNYRNHAFKVSVFVRQLLFTILTDSAWSLQDRKSIANLLITNPGEFGLESIESILDTRLFKLLLPLVTRDCSKLLFEGYVKAFKSSLPFDINDCLEILPYLHPACIKTLLDSYITANSYVWKDSQIPHDFLEALFAAAVKAPGKEIFQLIHEYFPDFPISGTYPDGETLFKKAQDLRNAEVLEYIINQLHPEEGTQIGRDAAFALSLQNEQ